MVFLDGKLFGWRCQGGSLDYDRLFCDLGSYVLLLLHAQTFAYTRIGFISQSLPDDANGRDQLGAFRILVFGRCVDLFWI